ncbi:MAG: hypothetical protein KBB52_06255 [Candidatus Omnitrophica bacterium]|nr:hypothetical protein [Candidatus Omnitrophota bacterium]
MKNIFFVLALFSVIIIVPAKADSFDLRRDDSGGMKVSLTSLPFLSDEEEDRESSKECSSSYDPEDAEYEVDTIGRKVPVRTRKSGSAIGTR